MDVFIEPPPWSDRPPDRHLLFAAGLLLFTGYLLFVLALAMIGPVTTAVPIVDPDRRIPVRFSARSRPVPDIPEPVAIETAPARPATSTAADKAPETAAANVITEQSTPPPDTAGEVEPAPAAAAPAFTGRIDLTMPRSEPALVPQPVCRAGPCAPGTSKPPGVRTKRRPASEILSDLDPEVLERLDLQSLGIDPGLADVFGERRVKTSRNCELVQRADNVVSRQMTSPQFIRCRRSSSSKARAQALLDALREKRPDLFDDR